MGWFRAPRVAAALAAGAVSLFLCPNPIRADEKDEEIRELRSRLERLEKIVGQVGVVPLSPASAPATINAQAAPLLTLDAPAPAVGEVQKKKTSDDWWTVGKDLTLKAKWDYGVWFATEDEAFRIHFGGRTQFDMIWANASDRVQFGKGGMGEMQDSFDFRRIRLEADGWMYETIDFW